MKSLLACVAVLLLASCGSQQKIAQVNTCNVPALEVIGLECLKHDVPGVSIYTHAAPALGMPAAVVMLSGRIFDRNTPRLYAQESQGRLNLLRRAHEVVDTRLGGLGCYGPPDGMVEVSGRVWEKTTCSKGVYLSGFITQVIPAQTEILIWGSPENLAKAAADVEATFVAQRVATK